MRRRNVINPIKAFLCFGAFIIALDACIALNRWWPENYIENLVIMSAGFTVFIVFSSKNKMQIFGFTILALAIFYVCDYEISGPSKLYLTALDPLLGYGPTFINGRASYMYRKTLAYSLSVLSILILSASKIKLQIKKPKKDIKNE